MQERTPAVVIHRLLATLTRLCALGLLALPGLHPLAAQTRELTAVVLINSADSTNYNPNTATPGSFQQGPLLYLTHLQVPYRLVDVSQVSAQDLTGVQLIIAGHAHLALSDAWQAAITAAVSGGTGFVNLDSDVSIGTQTHIRKIFQATGATLGFDQTTITIPAAVQVGGSSAHYITALQKHFIGDPAGDLTYKYHGYAVATPSDATLLTNAVGTVVAQLGTDPLIIATTYGQGRAVDFTTYGYMNNDRFGFAQGIDDLFWRSLVWAARKPFILRGYPHLAAIQMDDNEPGVMSRISDLWNTSYTGNLSSDGTGGPWKPQLNMQLSSLADTGGERAQLIAAIQANDIHASPHGLDYGSGGDLYWNQTVPVTDAGWQTNVASALTWKLGQGGADTFPTFSRSMVAHYWDISPNTGYEMFHSLGLRYITSAFVPGTYYFTDPKTLAQRLPLGPFRTFQQTPEYSGDDGETFPFFYADDLTVGSVAGKPAQTFFAFGSQVGLSSGRFPRADALFPSSQNGFTIAQSLDQWKYYMWHFWSGMEPVQIYTHDGDNMEYTSAADRQAFITQLSSWFSSNLGQHIFMDNMGDYLRARMHSTLAAASADSTNLHITFTGGATDIDGNPIDTKTFVFYGDDEGALLDVPGFSNGSSLTYPNQAAPTIRLSPSDLSFTTAAGNSPAPQSVAVSSAGPATYTWTATSNASWLSCSPTTGTQGTSTSVAVVSSTLATGTYTGQLTFSAPGATNSPQILAVTLTVSSAPALVPSPTKLAFAYTVGAAAPPSQSVAINNPAGTNLVWTARSNTTWLTVATATSGTPGSLVATVAPSGLAAGSYSATITVTPNDPSVAPITIPVTIAVSPQGATFTAHPGSLAFSAVAGSASSATQNLTLSSSPSSVSWTAAANVPWLTLSPKSGSNSPATIQVAAVANSLSAGTYKGIITLSPSAGSVATIVVTFTVSATSTARLSVAPVNLHLFSAIGTSVSPVQVTVANAGTGSMPWSAASNASWLLLSPASAGSPGVLTVSTNTAGLASGNQAGIATVTATGIALAPVPVAVTLHLGTLVFTDKFASGSAQWTVSPLGLSADWSVANNTFSNNGKGQSQQYAGSSTWTNYIVSADVQLANLLNYPAGLRGRVNIATGVSYAVWLYPADHIIKLFRTTAWNIDNGGLQLLGTSPVVNFDKLVHTLHLAFTGSQISVYYDSVPMITANDTMIPSGVIALDASSQPIAFSNISVIQQ